MESQQQLVANAEGEPQHLASRSPNLQSDDCQLMYPSRPPVSTHLLCEVGSLTARRAPAAAGSAEATQGLQRVQAEDYFGAAWKVGNIVL